MTIEEQKVLETAKLQRLEREAHQWVQQALPKLEKVNIIFPRMKQIFKTVEEKD